MVICWCHNWFVSKLVWLSRDFLQSEESRKNLHCGPSGCIVVSSGRHQKDQGSHGAQTWFAVGRVSSPNVEKFSPVFTIWLFQRSSMWLLLVTMLCSVCVESFLCAPQMNIWDAVWLLQQFTVHSRIFYSFIYLYLSCESAPLIFTGNLLLMRSHNYFLPRGGAALSSDECSWSQPFITKGSTCRFNWLHGAEPLRSTGG